MRLRFHAPLRQPLSSFLFLGCSSSACVTFFSKSSHPTLYFLDDLLSESSMQLSTGGFLSSLSPLQPFPSNPVSPRPVRSRLASPRPAHPTVGERRRFDNMLSTFPSSCANTKTRYLVPTDVYPQFPVSRWSLSRSFPARFRRPPTACGFIALLPQPPSFRSCTQLAHCDKVRYFIEGHLCRVILMLIGCIIAPVSPPSKPIQLKLTATRFDIPSSAHLCRLWLRRLRCFLRCRPSLRLSLCQPVKAHSDKVRHSVERSSLSLWLRRLRC